MPRERHIPEDRIRRLASFVSIVRTGNNDEEWLERHMIEGMGRAIAEKLFEFKKVLIVCGNEDGGMRLTARAELDVIVPYGPPPVSLYIHRDS